jgi:DASS family divalent anion:Na+ symporter
MLTGAHANLITAAMFMTGMAANPLVSDAAKVVFNIDFSWGMWALGSIVPGLLGLALLPILIKFLSKPTMTDTSAARQKARQELEQMRKPSPNEKIMGGVFIMLLLLWMTSSLHGLGTTTVALIGVSVLLLSNALTWEQVITNKGAWDTLVWLGGLLALANGLKEIGFIDWFADGTFQYLDASNLFGLGIVIAIALVYFYSMYGFSMLTAHISAMALAFLTIAYKVDAPPLLTIGLIAYFSNLCACLTNYSTGPVIIYFGYHYVKSSEWFKTGFIVSLYHMIIWLGAGLVWWKIIGWW